MLVRVDRESDALYIELAATPVEESEEIASGVILDYDNNGNLVGIEILDASKKGGVDTLRNIHIAA